MIISELIEELQKFPLDMDVRVFDNYGNMNVIDGIAPSLYTGVQGKPFVCLAVDDKGEYPD